MMKKVIILLAVILLLAGCGKKEEQVPTATGVSEAGSDVSGSGTDGSGLGTDALGEGASNEGSGAQGGNNAQGDTVVQEGNSTGENNGVQAGNDASEGNAAVSEDSSGKASEAQTEEITDYPFEYNGVTIHMNTKAAPAIEALGKEIDYFEAPSCAFQGMDKIYYYSGIELGTYPLEDVDYISSVNFLDDSVSTKRGIYLGASLEEVINAYGDGYTEDMGLYTYTLGESELTILVEDNVVTAITYMAVLDDKQ